MLYVWRLISFHPAVSASISVREKQKKDQETTDGGERIEEFFCCCCCVVLWGLCSHVFSHLECDRSLSHWAWPINSRTRHSAMPHLCPCCPRASHICPVGTCISLTMQHSSAQSNVGASAGAACQPLTAQHNCYFFFCFSWPFFFCKLVKKHKSIFSPLLKH